MKNNKTANVTRKLYKSFGRLTQRLDYNTKSDMKNADISDVIWIQRAED